MLIACQKEYFERAGQHGIYRCRCMAPRVTCLLRHFSKESTEMQYMQGTWRMPWYCKCWVNFRGIVLNALGSVRSPGDAARLYWETCLPGHFSEKGTVTQHMQVTWPMKNHSQCWLVAKRNGQHDILRHRCTITKKSACQVISVKNAPRRSICRGPGHYQDAVNVEWLLEEMFWTRGAVWHL